MECFTAQQGRTPVNKNWIMYSIYSIICTCFNCLPSQSILKQTIKHAIHILFVTWLSRFRSWPSHVLVFLWIFIRKLWPNWGVINETMSLFLLLSGFKRLAAALTAFICWLLSVQLTSKPTTFTFLVWQSAKNELALTSRKKCFKDSCASVRWRIRRPVNVKIRNSEKNSCDELVFLPEFRMIPLSVSLISPLPSMWMDLLRVAVL